MPKKKNIEWKTPRRVFLVFLFLILVLFARYCYIALSPTINGRNMKVFAANRNTVSRVLTAKRGNIYDMSGNVWEWCGDLYTKEYKQGGKSIHQGWPFEGTYLFFRRILRGGSWGGTAKGCRVSYIDYDIENYSDEYGGFRLVMEPESIK